MIRANRLDEALRFEAGVVRESPFIGSPANGGGFIYVSI
jgi:hypothetical protein